MTTTAILLVDEKGLARVRAVPLPDGRYRIDHIGRDLRWHEAARVPTDRVDEALAFYPYRRA